MRKVYSKEVIEGLKRGGHYLFTEKSYQYFVTKCTEEYPQLFPPNWLIVMEPVANKVFCQVSWENTDYNTPK
jgi:hypothetical protein